MASGGGGTAAIATSVPGAPVTAQRPVPTDLDGKLPQPAVPRANKAVSRERPEGSPNSLAREDYSVMQQHVDFFDPDKDGVIWPWDTYTGFRRIGFNALISALAVPFIHFSFSYPTVSGLLPDPFMRIFVRNMHRGKHGSDSEVYDTEGRFVPDKFEAVFSKYDRGGKGGLDWGDVNAMIRGNQNIVDPVGWAAARFEWWALWLLCADERGLVSKEKVRASFDGSLWYLLADENEKRAAARKAAARSKWD